MSSDSEGFKVSRWVFISPSFCTKKKTTNQPTTHIVSRPLNGMVFGHVCNSSLKGFCNERIRCFWGKTQHFWRCLPVWLVVEEEEEVTFPRKITNRWAGVAWCLVAIFNCVTHVQARLQHNQPRLLVIIRTVGFAII